MPPHTLTPHPASSSLPPAGHAICWIFFLPHLKGSLRSIHAFSPCPLQQPPLSLPEKDCLHPLLLPALCTLLCPRLLSPKLTQPVVAQPRGKALSPSLSSIWPGDTDLLPKIISLVPHTPLAPLPSVCCTSLEPPPLPLPPALLEAFCSQTSLLSPAPGPQPYYYCIPVSSWPLTLNLFQTRCSKLPLKTCSLHTSSQKPAPPSTPTATPKSTIAPWALLPFG